MSIELIGKIRPSSKQTTKKLYSVDTGFGEMKRDKALWGRTCPEPETIKSWKQEDSNEGMTPELESKLWLLDQALKEVDDEEYGHYLVEKVLGMADEPESIRYIEEFEAKYLS